MRPDNQTSNTETPDSPKNTADHVDNRETARIDPASTTPPLAKDKRIYGLIQGYEDINDHKASDTDDR